ncbi:hypothetical protein JCM10213v2_008596 [Rhodosporidiobolus nylandii]
MFTALLNWLRALFWTTTLDVACIGLQNAGKTSLVNVLTNNDFSESMIPTTLKVWDLAGQPRFRSIWERYCRGVSAIIWVVDSADPETFPVARVELESLLGRGELGGIPLLVLGNKSDLPHHATVDDLIRELGLRGIVNREVSVYSISARTPQAQQIRIPTFRSPEAKQQQPQRQLTREEERRARFKSGNQQWQSLNAFAAASGGGADLGHLLGRRGPSTSSAATAAGAGTKSTQEDAQEPEKAKAGAGRKRTSEVAPPHSPPTRAADEDGGVEAPVQAKAKRARRSLAPIEEKEQAAAPAEEGGKRPVAPQPEGDRGKRPLPSLSGSLGAAPAPAPVPAAPEATKQPAPAKAKAGRVPRAAAASLSLSSRPKPALPAPVESAAAAQQSPPPAAGSHVRDPYPPLALAPPQPQAQAQEKNEKPEKRKRSSLSSALQPRGGRAEAKKRRSSAVAGAEEPEGEIEGERETVAPDPPFFPEAEEAAGEEELAPPPSPAPATGKKRPSLAGKKPKSTPPAPPASAKETAKEKDTAKEKAWKKKGKARAAELDVLEEVLEEEVEEEEEEPAPNEKEKKRRSEAAKEVKGKSAKARGKERVVDDAEAVEEEEEDEPARKKKRRSSAVDEDDGKKPAKKGGKKKARSPPASDDDEPLAGPSRLRPRASASASTSHARLSSPRLPTPPPLSSSPPPAAAQKKRKKRSSAASTEEQEDQGRAERKVRILTERLKGNKGRLNVWDVVAGGSRKILDRLREEATDSKAKKALKGLEREVQRSYLQRSSLLTTLLASHTLMTSTKTRAKKLRLQLLEVQRERSALSLKTEEGLREWEKERREAETVSRTHAFLAGLEKAAGSWR